MDQQINQPSMTPQRPTAAPSARQGASGTGGPGLPPPPPSRVPQIESEGSEDDDLGFARRFSALSKKDKAQREREQKIAERETSMKEREQKIAELEMLMQDPRKNALSLFKHLGLSYQELTDIMLADPSEQMPTTEEQLERLRERLDAKEKAEKEQEEELVQQRDAEVIERAQQQIKAYVESQGDTYELITLSESHGMIWDVIEEYERTYGQLPKIEDACQQVENYLEQQLRPFTSAKKFSGTSNSKSSPQAPQANQRQSFRKSAPTLSAQVVSSNVGPVQAHTPSTDRSERRRELAQKLRFNKS